MSDLQNKLSLGPQQVKKAEDEESATVANEAEEKEKAPLADARKGRARGPQRRKPAVSPAAAAATTTTTTTSEAESKAGSELVAATTVWSIDDEEGVLDVPAHTAAEALQSLLSKSQVHPPPPVQDAAAAKPVSDQPTPRSEKSDPISAVSGGAATGMAAASTATDAPSLALSREEDVADKDSVTAPLPSRPVQSTLEGENEPVAKEVLQQEGQKRDEVTQTGELEMVISDKEKLTAFVGGNARDEGTVVVESAKEQGEGDEQEA
ncbi:MAG: hypothetical protein Q9157_001465 [Trypethelium eluteriae]